jgi:hypothetical protein
MAKAVKTAAETNGIRINNRIASKTADSLIYANIHSNRARGISSLWDFTNINAIKKGKLQQDEAAAPPEAGDLETPAPTEEPINGLRPREIIA